MMNLPEGFEAGLPSAESLDLSDRWVLSTLNTVAKSINENLEKFELGLAAQKIQDFIWDVYCDWYIEIAKVRLNSDNQQEADNARKVLVYVLSQALYTYIYFHAFYYRGNLSGIAGQRKNHHDTAMACL